MAARICRFFIANKYRRCDCFSGRFLFYRNLQTITLRWKLFSVLTFMLSEMFPNTIRFSGKGFRSTSAGKRILIILPGQFCFAESCRCFWLCL